ncbi:hypothetical protein II906_12110, partial [bacterium]|nr:hypothetical protein [bacterium]
DKKNEEMLKVIAEKVNDIEPIKAIDILDIKNSVENIENTISDSQSKLNFEDIKEKLEKIAFQLDNCNETILKDFTDDINELKETSKGVNQHLENIQNVQNLALTNAEFDEFQKQQLDLAVKSN